MREKIVEKLNRVISQPVESEERVVYLIVEIRNLLMEARIGDTDFLTLRFFCNWALHTQISRGEGSTIVRLMNAAYDERLHGKYLTEEQHQHFSDVFSFEAFRQELLEFLQTQGIRFSSFELYPQWIAFVGLYATLVADSPVTYTRKDLPLKWMDRAVLTTFPIEAEDLAQIRLETPFAEGTFGLRWTFFKGDRQVMRWERPIIFEDYDKVPAPEIKGEPDAETNRD